MISQVTIVTVTFLGYAFATNYGGKDVGVGGDVSASGYAGKESSGHRGTQNYPLKPYQLHYSAGDGRTYNYYRNEQSEESGTVKGAYGYRDVQGLYRVVQYVADARGFRANITSNEPGIDGKENPAAVIIVAKKPPAGIQYRWTGGNCYDRPPPIRCPVRPPVPIHVLMPNIRKSKCDTGENFNIIECVIGVGSG